MTHSIEFALFAPYNDSVKLIGNWNNFADTAMQKGDDGVWRTQVDLADGTYEYKFKVVSKSWFAEGKEVVVADPLAHHITLDNRENAVVKIKNGKKILTEYEWHHDDKFLPANHQLVIYEMHLGDFRGGIGDDTKKPGTFREAIEKLDYLAELGITAIELMPVNEFPGHHSWGYSLRNIYAVENSYGTVDDFCHFVDECHARGIRVIMDMVYNHMEADAPLTQIDYTYWFYGDNPDPADLDFGPKFNYEFYDENLKIFPAREHVIGAMNFFVEHFHIDGIRFDCTRALRYYELLQWFHDEAHRRASFKPFYTIAEHVPQDPTIADADGPMDAAWHDSFYRQIAATILAIPHDGRDPYNTGELLRVLDGRKDGFASVYNTVKYTDNHDQTRTMRMLGEYANMFDEVAFRRAKLGASLLLTAPGVPMLWMGQEVGQATPKTMEPQPFQWALLEQNHNQGLFQHYKHLMGLRRNNPALTSPNYEAVANWHDRAIIAFKRWNDQGNVVLVVANLQDKYAGEFSLGGAGLEDGTWREVIYNYEVSVNDGVLTDSLGESDVKIYIKI
jgi:1,4-alpha-glucan branching enzyme